MRHICISVIVPVYNASAYVAESLSSIQAQTFKDWECICVDDGSSDDSPRIVEGFAANDKRFRLIRQKNGGPGAARNTGLKAAQGEYFTFVDADDRVHPQMLERLLDLAKGHRADLVVCDYFRFESDDEFGRSVLNPEFLADEAEVEKAPLLPEMVNWRKFRVHPVGKLYQHALHGVLRFPHLYGSEDAYASFDVYGRSNCAVFSKMRLYGYRVVEDGLVRSVSKYRNYIIGDAQVAVHCEAVCREHRLSNAVTKQLFMPYVMRMFGYLNQMSLDARLSKKEKKSLMQLARKGFRNIERYFEGKYQIVPFVHYVPYSAVRVRALWLLVLWQYVRIYVFPFLRKNRKGSTVKV
jgi:glycosyltransferase involved in cell wall biosynthesis